MHELRIFYDKNCDCFWFIDTRTSTVTQLTENRLKEILSNAKAPSNLDVVKENPKQLFLL